MKTIHIMSFCINIYPGKDSIVGQLEPREERIFGYIAAVVVRIDSVLNSPQHIGTDDGIVCVTTDPAFTNVPK